MANLERLAPLGEGPVLDLGCGAGRHLVPLAHSGVRVVGLDLAAPLLNEATARRDDAKLDFALLRADMRQIPLVSESVSAVLSLFTAFGYFGGLLEHRNLLLEIARVLTAGGHWFFDYFNCELVRQELGDGRPRERTRQQGPLLIKERRQLTADPLLVTKRVEMLPLPGNEAEAAALQISQAGLQYTEQVALFTLPELADLTAACGLDLVARAGGYSGETFDAHRSQRWLLAFQKHADNDRRGRTA